MNKNEFVFLYKTDNMTGKYSKESHLLKNKYNIYLDIINYSIK